MEVKVTKDTLFAGEVICYQNVSGYRFSLDSVLLADFVLGWKKVNVLDLGCGNGILGLILLYRIGEKIERYTGMEIQEKLMQLANKNSIANGFTEKVTLHHCDFCTALNRYMAESFSHVICNPPFYQLGRGRISDNQEAYLARHQVTATLPDIARTAAYFLKNKGQIALIYPAEYLSELIIELQAQAIVIKRLRLVYSYPESSSAKLVLVEGVKNGGVGQTILQPLYIYTEKNGHYSEDVEQMYSVNSKIPD